MKLLTILNEMTLHALEKVQTILLSWERKYHLLWDEDIDAYMRWVFILLNENFAGETRILYKVTDVKQVANMHGWYKAFHHFSPIVGGTPRCKDRWMYMKQTSKIFTL